MNKYAKVLIMLTAVIIWLTPIAECGCSAGSESRGQAEMTSPAPAGMIGASNFFELSVAVAISLFGTNSPVVLATIVGVLVEVPVMLTLVGIAKKTAGWFRHEVTA